MDKKQCKSYLQSYRFLKIEIKNNQEYREERYKYFIHLYKIIGKNKFSEPVKNYFKHIDEYNSFLIAETKNIESTINQVKDKEIRNVLIYRFIENKSLDEIVVLIYRNYTSVCKLSAQGVDECANIL